MTKRQHTRLRIAMVGDLRQLEAVSDASTSTHKNQVSTIAETDKAVNSAATVTKNKEKKMTLTKEAMMEPARSNRKRQMEQIGPGKKDGDRADHGCD